MGIERPEEADVPVVADRNQAEAQSAAEPQDQQAYRARYRVIVDDVNRDARDQAWHAAVLELRRAWEEHEAKWPRADDCGQPSRPAAPGAWRGDGDRCLDPEANAEVERGCGRIREIGENVITPAMRTIESEDPERHLIGLEHRLKGTERLKEKVAAELEARPGLTAAQALASVPDAIRFTFCYSDEHYVAGVTADLERLTARRFELAKPLKNSWDSDQYKGINSQWREPETGQRFEVQFHTRASFEAKQLSHAAYERIRDQQTSGAELDELEDFQRQVCAKIPIPSGSTDITYVPGEERDA